MGAVMKTRNAKTAKAIAAFWGKDLERDKRDWYAIKALDDGETEIRIYDIIGWPFVEADQFVSELSGINVSKITVRLNSPGGDVFDGTAIYNALKDHPATITTRIEGLAASMASIIALAGDKIEIAKNAYFMIHNPWSIALGDHNDFAAEADFLQRIAGTLADVYAEKTGKQKNEIARLMDDETWYIGQEAIDAGFVDSLTNQSNESARFDLSMYAHAPKPQSAPNKRDLERVLMQYAALTRTQARRMLQSGLGAIVTQDADENDHQEAAQSLVAKMKGATCQI